MPAKPMRPCRYPNCPHLTRDKSGYCQDHLRLTRKQQDRERGTPAQRGYGKNWQRYRKWYLNQHPYCVKCGKPATVVDHIRPHRGDYNLFWDPNNHEPMCSTCHNTKTAREDGAFGNPIKGKE